MRGVSHFRAVFRRALVFFPAFRAADGRAAALFHTLAQVKNGVRAVFISCFFAFAVFAAQAVALTHSAAAQTNAAANMTLQAEIEKKSPSLVTVLQALEAGADPDHKAGEVPLLIVAATMGHAEIVSVLVTAGADPDARWKRASCVSQTVGRAVPHLVAQNNYRPTLYYTWGTALNVLRHFADAVNQTANATTYDWNAEGVSPNCGSTNPAIDFLASRFRNDEASLPEESDDEKYLAIMGMADIMLANKASCANAGIPKHVTCAGSAAAAEVCPPGQGVMYGGNLGGRAYDGIWCVVCPVGQGVLANNTCGVCPTGQVVQGGICVAIATCDSPAVLNAETNQCDCPSGYSGAGGVCNADVTVSFSPPVNGTLSAASGGDSIQNGGTVVHGATVTFTATPASGYEVSIWTGGCAGAVGVSCEAVATVNVSAGVEFFEASAASCGRLSPAKGYDDSGAGACEVCSSGEGVLADGTCGVCPVGQGVLADNTCGACPVGEGVLADSACGVCPVGQVVQGGVCVAIATCDSPAVLNAETNQCDCPSGYSGVGGVCNADVTVSFSPPANGTLSAASGGDSIQNGGTVAHGATVTFTAAPASGYEVSIWTGGCAGAVGVSCEAVATANVSAGVEFFEASAASCGRLIPAKGYDDSGAGACVAPSAESCGRLSPVKGYDDSGAGACVAASAESCRRLSPAQGYDDSGAGACEVCPFGYDAEAEACVAHEDVLLAEIRKDSPSLVTVLQALEAGASPDHKAGEVPLLIVAATMGHAEIVSVLVTAGADPDARWKRASLLASCSAEAVGRAVPHVVAQNNYRPTLYYTWGTALNVLRHFADAVSLNATATYNWNAEGVSPNCGSTNPAIDFLASRFSNDEASLPEESDDEKYLAIMGMADIMLANKASCANAGIANHVTCAGSAAAAAVCSPGQGVMYGRNLGGWTYDGIWCVDCPVGQGVLANNTCGVCPTGQVVQGGICVAIATCDSPAVLNAETNQCDCPSGYSGAGGVCNADVTVSFSPPVNGTLSAASGGDSIQNGGTVVHGATVTFTATPASGYEVSIWTGGCAGAVGVSCEAVATVNVSAGVEFFEASAASCGRLSPAKGYDDSGAGACEVCSSGEGVLADGTCGVCPVGQGVLADNTCGACPVGEGVLADSACGVCPVGQVVQGGVCVAIATCDSPAVLNAETNQCDCPSGYSGVGGVCNADVTVSFSPPANGTLSAASGGDSIQNGGTVAHGATVTFTAAPASGYEVSIWTGGCAGAVGVSCEAVATANVSAGVEFFEANAASCGRLIPAQVYDGSGCFAPGAASCGRLSPAQAYDSAAKACVVRTEEELREKCTAAGWTWMNGQCSIRWNNHAEGRIGRIGQWCSYRDSLKCADIVGPDYDFPSAAGVRQPTYVYNCDVDGSTGMIPATINTIGATACACPAGQVVQDDVCVAASAESCRRLSPAQGYDDSGAGACEVCSSGEGVLADGTCGVCLAGQVILGGACTAPSAESCGRLSPTKGYDDSGAGACVAPSAASCGRLSPVKGYDDSGAGACVAPSAASCESVTPAMVYDAAAGECAFLFPAVCASPSVRNKGTNLCDCQAPNIGENGAAAPGFCHGELALITVAQDGDVALVARLIAAGATVDVTDNSGYTPLHWAARGGHLPVVAELIAAKASVNVINNNGRTALYLAEQGVYRHRYNPASIPLLIEAGGHWGTECASPNVVNPAGPTPPCAAVAVCTSPSVRNKGTNLCDCPVLNEGTGGGNAGTDGAEAPGNCAAAGETSCGELTPAQFYDAAARKCVAVADCLAPATLDADKNLCDCSLPNIGTDDASAPGDCAVPAPDETICGGLSPPQFYDAAAGECVAFAVCAAPAVLDEDENLCDCPSPNIGTDGLAAPGFCRSEYALHTAVRDGDLDFVGRFLAVVPRAEVSVFVNARNNGGWTPLHQAARFNRPAIALTLLAAGASVNVSNNGHTPLRYADSYKNAGLYPHLIAAGGHWGTACAAGEFVNPAGPNPSCVAVSAASCGEASSAKGYDPAADACVAPSPASCGELSPAKGYHLVADACVAPSAASCRRLSPAQGYDDSGAGACVAPSAASCGRLSPTKGYDPAARACVAPSAASCGRLSPVKGYDDSGAGACVAPSAASCRRLSPAQGYDDSGAGACVAPSAASCGRLSPVKGYDPAARACVAPSAASCGRLSPVKGYDDSGAGACVAPSAASCRRLFPAQGYDDSGAGACEVCPFGYDAEAEACVAHEDVLLAEIRKDSPSLVTVLQALEAGASPDHKAGEVPLLIVAATMGHAEIVSVLVTAGADPDARWKRASCGSQTVGRAVPHVVAQNNYRPTLYYTWGTALNVLRHFADAVSLNVTATYDWNAEGVSPNCGSTNPAIDFLASRFRNDEASLPEESDDEKYLAIMGMADIMLANKASCANAGIPKHVTCAGSAAAAEVCPPGQGVMYGGNLGGRAYDGIWCVVCPVGQGVLANNTCGVCPAGQVVQGGICVAIATCDSPAVLNAETNQCDCPSGYSGAGGVCNADVTVSFSPPVNGTLSAASGGDSIQNGGTVVHGATVTFTATPASGYEVSIWTGGCAGAVGVSCEAVATVNVSAGVEFFEASAASCGRLSPAKGYDDSGAAMCVEPSAASCRRLSPAQGYDDSGAGACEVCSSGQGVLADGTCGVCPTGQVILDGACTAPSAASCGRLIPAKGYDDSGAGACVAPSAASCGRLSPTKGYDDSGAGACVAPGAASCGRLSPAQAYDSAAKACVVRTEEYARLKCTAAGRSWDDSGRCQIRWINKAGSSSGDSGSGDWCGYSVIAPKCADIVGPDYDFPNRPDDGSALTTYVYNCDVDGSTGMIPATINTIGATACACPAGQGVDENGVCVAASAESCGRLSPVKGYDDSGAGACVAPSAASCVRLSPARAYDEAARACVVRTEEYARGKCTAVGRRWNDRSAGCTINWYNYEDNRRPHLSAPWCYYRGNPAAPKCADIVGPDYDFRRKIYNVGVSGEVQIVYNCDVAGITGMIPATINTIGATACACPAGQGVDENGVCVAASAESCRRLSPAQGYDDSGAGACEVCSSGEGVLADGTCGVCLAGQVILGGACTAPSAASCGRLSPTKGYDDSGAGACVAPSAASCGRLSPTKGYDDSGAGACVAPGAASCGRLSPVKGYDDSGAGACTAPSAASCGRLSPAQGYDDSGAGACVAPSAASCGRLSPVKGYDDSGAGACVAPSAASCESVTPAMVYDAAAGECAFLFPAVCASPSVRNKGTNLCDCQAPNIGENGAAAPGFCHGKLALITVAQDGDVALVARLIAAGATVDVTDNSGYTPLHWAARGGHLPVVAELIAAKASVNVINSSGRTALYLAEQGVYRHRYNPASIPLLIEAGGHWGTECASPNVVNPAGPTPPCAAVAVCTSPSVRNKGTNLCDCPVENEGTGGGNAGTDGAEAPGNCAAAGETSCGELTPAQFYDAAARKCVAVADCLAPATLDADKNLCDCSLPNIGTDDASAPGDCAVPAPDETICGGLSPPQFYDAAAGECVAFAVCAAPAVLDEDENLCDCPSPNIGTDGLAAPGFCRSEYALHTAVRDGDLDFVGRFLAVVPRAEVSVFVNARNNGGWTPLHQAARFNRPAIALTLLAAGASVNVSNSGHTPLSYAGSYKNAGLYPHLIAAGGHWGTACAAGEFVNSAGPNPSCVAVSAASCGEASSAKGYDPAADACVAPSPASCGELSPAKGYHLVADACVAPSAASCRRLSPAKGYDDSGAGACEVCPSGQGVLADGTCGVCPTGQVILDGACTAPSAASCGRLIPAKGYDDSGAGACVAPSAASCGRLSPVKGYDDSGAGACVAPGAASCGRLSPAQAYDSAAKACVVRTEEYARAKCTAAGWDWDNGQCGIRSNNHAEGRISQWCEYRYSECADIVGPDYDFPNKPKDGPPSYYVYNCDVDGSTGMIPATINTIGATVCACPVGQGVDESLVCGVAASAASCGRLSPAHGYDDSGAGVCEVCPSGQGVLADGTCGVCPTGQVILDGACTAPSAASCGRLIPAKGYDDSGAGACVAPSVASCDRLSPAQVYDGSGCFAPSAASCGRLSPTKGYDPAARACVAPSAASCWRLSPVRVYDEEAEACVLRTAEEVKEKCTTAGWDWDGGQYYSSFHYCNIRWENRSALRKSFWCIYTASSSDFPNLDEPNCADIVGPDYDFPRKIDDRAYYVYNCDVDGITGLIPATINTIGATACACPNGQGVDEGGVCGVAASVESCGRLSPAQAYDSTAGACVVRTEEYARLKCTAAGRQSGRGGCLIRWNNYADGSDGYSCGYSAFSPKCADIVGPDYDFPKKSGDVFAPTAYVYNCDVDGSTGMIPATINTIGATACACPAGQVVQGGVCVAIATCDSPAVLNAETNQCDCPSGYSGAGGVCNADVTVSFSPPVNGTLSAASGGNSIQNGGTVVHGATVTFTAAPASGYEVSIWTGGCAGAVGVSCEAVATADVSAGVEFFEASAASCGRLSPAQGYDDSGAGACVAPSAASCGRLSPTKGYDDSGAGACVAPSAASCESVTPAKVYDAAAGECAFLFPAVCASPSVRNKGTNLCDCPAPNIGENGAAAPGFCHGEYALNIAAQNGDVALVVRLIAAGALVDGRDAANYTPLHRAALRSHIPVIAELIAAKASLNVTTNTQGETPLVLAERGVSNNGYNRASIPLLIEAGGHWGTECASPNVVNPAGPTPPCAAVAVCTSPSVRNKGTNRCDCPVENEGTGGGNAGTDGEEAPGNCAAAGETSCGELTPAQFYDAAARKCVAVADCLAPATLDADKNLCDCSLPNIGTDDASAPGDCAVPAPDETICKGLSPAQFYDAAAGECVAFAVCAAPAVLDADENLCDCPSPNIGTDGLAAPGFCRSEYALHTAVRDGDLDFVGRFLAVVPRAEVSVFVNARNNGGWTPLHQAARFNRPAIALTLLAAGASVNVSNNGHTPLRYADSYKNAGLYPHLIAAGGHWGTACAAGEFVNPAGPNPSCVAVSAASCGEASSAKGYDPAADACVAPSPASCGELSPAKGYHLVADACVAPSAASCGRLSPAKGYDDSGAGACVAPGAASCGRLSPAQAYDSAAKACVVRTEEEAGAKCTAAGWTWESSQCSIKWNNHAESRIDRRNGQWCGYNGHLGLKCGDIVGPDYDFPNKPEDGSSPRYVFNCDVDGSTGMIPATINTIGATACACPAGQGVDEKGVVCVAASAESCGRLSPVKGYDDSGAGACVAPSAASCVRLSPEQFYDDSGAGECVAFAVCDLSAVLNKGTNECDCRSGYSGAGGVCNADVTVSFSPPVNGGLSAASGGNSIQNGGTVVHGATVTFTATPALGWYVEGWNNGGCAGDVGSAASPGEEKECDLSAESNLLVTVTFAVAREVVFGEGLFASLTADGASVASGDTFADGTTIGFLATPPENREIAGWTNDGAEVCVGQNPCVLAAADDLDVRAEFQLVSRLIGYSEVPGGNSGGTLTASVPSGGTTLHGATVTFTATPAAGWYVEGWNNGGCAGDVGSAASPGAEKECDLSAEADLLVTVTFAVAREVVFGEGLFASLTADGASVASGDTFADGTTIGFLATPPENRELAGWTNDGAEVCVGQNPCILEAADDLDVRAEFQLVSRLIGYSEVPGGNSGGTLTASVPSGGTTLHGATVTFHGDAGGGVVC